MADLLDPSPPLSPATAWADPLRAFAAPRPDADADADAEPAAVPPLALSEPLRLLVAAVAAVRAQAPADLPAAQAVAESAVLLEELEKLHAVGLARIADVDTRELHGLQGSPSTGSWLVGLGVGLDRSEVALARTFRRLPALAQAVTEGALSVPAAVKVSRALDELRPFLDRPDGLIDGQDGEGVLAAVIVDGVAMLVGQARGGCDDQDGDFAALLGHLREVAARPGSQLARLEAAFLVLAAHVDLGQLRSALGYLVDALLPVQLQARADRTFTERGLELLRKADGSGWTIRHAELDLECGELLWTVLQACRATDLSNSADTAAWAQSRHAGLEGQQVLGGLTGCGPDTAGPGTAGPDTAGPDTVGPGAAGGGLARPRSRRERDHDALSLGLRALLDSGGLGLREKVAPHILVTVTLDTLNESPGALPAVAGSGTAVPGRLVGRWLANSRISRLVLTLGRKPLETSHSERTLKSHERRALAAQWGGRCAGAGCSRSLGTSLVPHHVVPWASSGRTSLADTVPLCASTHHDLHVGTGPSASATAGGSTSSAGPPAPAADVRAGTDLR